MVDITNNRQEKRAAVAALQTVDKVVLRTQFSKPFFFVSACF